MKLEKYKIQENKFGFIALCMMFLVGLVLTAKIADFATETVEIEAVVVHTYVAPFSRHSPGTGGPKMNIEWVDLNGEVQREGSLANRAHLEMGDTCTILVDAKTQSRRVYTKAGNVFTVVIGVLLCIISIKMMSFFYGKEKH